MGLVSNSLSSPWNDFHTYIIAEATNTSNGFGLTEPGPGYCRLVLPRRRALIAY